MNWGFNVHLRAKLRGLNEQLNTHSADDSNFQTLCLTRPVVDCRAHTPVWTESWLN